MRVTFAQHGKGCVSSFLGQHPSMLSHNKHPAPYLASATIVPSQLRALRHAGLGRVMSYLRDSKALFSLVDDGAGGRLQTVKRLMKFQLRCLWYRSHLQKLLTQLTALGLDALIDQHPHTITRTLRSYLDSRLSMARRVNAQLGYFEWAKETLRSEHLQALYRGDGYELWYHDFDPQGCKILLSSAAKMGREGELELTLVFDGSVLERLAFTMIPDGYRNGEPCLWVGGIQGMQHQREAARSLQHKLSRLRTSTVLITALKALASAWGVERLYAVGDEAHVFSAYRWTLRKRRHRHYDHLWREHDAQRVDDGAWALSPSLELRSLEEVKSQKRAELKRKNQWRSLIFAKVCERARCLTGQKRGTPG